MRRKFGYAALLLFLLAFPYGPLFPWSPVKPGYETERFTRADVVYPSGTAVPEPYKNIDSLIAEAEQFHRLAMPHHLTVIACRNWEDFRRFTINRSRAVAAVTLAPGTVIYVTPKIAEKGLDTGEFLRHEISHAALHQNQSIWNAFKMTKQEWFSEGLAVSFGRQRAYLTRDEFLARARVEDLGPVIDLDQWKGGARDLRFAYVAWRYFLEDLIAAKGRDRFQDFMTAYIRDPDSYRDSFRRVYGQRVPEAVAEFQTRAGGR